MASNNSSTCQIWICDVERNWIAHTPGNQRLYSHTSAGLSYCLALWYTDFSISQYSGCSGYYSTSLYCIPFLFVLLNNVVSWSFQNCSNFQDFCEWFALIWNVQNVNTLRNKTVMRVDRITWRLPTSSWIFSVGLRWMPGPTWYASVVLPSCLASAVHLSSPCPLSAIIINLN